MKVQAITINTNNLTFGDDCGFVPDSYRYSNALETMKKRQYVVQGINTKDAFSRMFDDINATLKEAAISPGGDWFDPCKTYTGKTKYTVHKWDMPKEKFSELMTRFWNFGKNSLAKSSDDLADEFLTQKEGLKKPNFFQQFLPKYSEYVESKSLLKNIIDNFLKTNKHRLG